MRFVALFDSIVMPPGFSAALRSTARSRMAFHDQRRLADSIEVNGAATDSLWWHHGNNVKSTSAQCQNVRTRFGNNLIGTAFRKLLDKRGSKLLCNQRL